MQVEQADEFRLLAEENRINVRLIPPARGPIPDRKGTLIAGNEQNYRIVHGARGCRRRRRGAGPAGQR